MDDELINRVTIIQRTGETPEPVIAEKEPRSGSFVLTSSSDRRCFGATIGPIAAEAMAGCWKDPPLSSSRVVELTTKRARRLPSESCRRLDHAATLPEDINMATQPTAREEHRETESQNKLPLVVVELSRRRSPEQVRRLRRGRGKLLTDIEDAVDELVKSGTIKSGTQPVVVVVREATLPLLWALDYEEDEDEDEDDDDDDDDDDD